MSTAVSGISLVRLSDAAKPRCCLRYSDPHPLLSEFQFQASASFAHTNTCLPGSQCC